MTGIYNAGSELVQVVVDHFNADISSQNGKLSTHAFAVLMTQSTTQVTGQEMSKTIVRINKENMTYQLEYDVDIQRYIGPKKTEMPKKAAVRSVLSLKILASQVISKRELKKMILPFSKIY